jgi:hypothetical protein
MRGRKPNELALSARDKRDLQKLLRDGHTPQRIAQRARILLACAGGNAPVKWLSRSGTNVRPSGGCVTAIVSPVWGPRYRMRHVRVTCEFFPPPRAQGD